MAIKYQFNKTSMQSLKKQLKIREKALPTLKAKESALRMTIKKRKQSLKEMGKDFEEKVTSIKEDISLWSEFPGDVFLLKEVLLDAKKIAGVKTPVLQDLDYEISDFSRLIRPAWLTSGIQILKEVTQLLTKIEVERKSIEILEYARKKTTQKVNLYEKVQIPAFAEAILKIKRYLEDVENLSKSAQKITKQRQAAAAAAAGGYA